MKAPLYQIRTVRDFLTVPKHRRTQCLTEFIGWLAYAEVAMLRDAPADIGPFIWHDDGIGGVRVAEPDFQTRGYCPQCRRPRDEMAQLGCPPGSHRVDASRLRA